MHTPDPAEVLKRPDPVFDDRPITLTLTPLKAEAVRQALEHFYTGREAMDDQDVAGREVLDALEEVMRDHRVGKVVATVAELQKIDTTDPRIGVGFKVKVTSIEKVFEYSRLAELPNGVTTVKAFGGGLWVLHA